MEKRRIYAVCSLKGGVGCSTVCAGLAAASARGGKRTLAVDLDVRFHSLDFFFGMQDRTLLDLSSFLMGKVKSDGLLVQDASLENLWLCPAPDRECFRKEGEKDLFLKMLEDGGFERVYLDLSGAGRDTLDAVGGMCDGILGVTVQNPASVLATQILFEEWQAEAREDGAKKFLIINRFDVADLKSYRNGRQRAQEIIDQTHLPLLGILPESYSLLRRTEEGLLSSLPEERADAPFFNMAARLEGRQIPLFEGTGIEKLRKRL